MSVFKVGLMTGGGDAPGLNAAIAGFTRALARMDIGVEAYRYGWKGLVKGGETLPLLSSDTNGLPSMPGTFLGTSRENPLKSEEKIQSVIQNLQKSGVHGLVAMGGDDTLSVATELSKRGVRVIGVPKTMDLDLSGTDYSVGYWSYVESVFRSMGGFITTCMSHNRIGVCEVFGRHSGYTAVAIGITSDAHAILIPEQPFNLPWLDFLVGRLAGIHEEKGYALAIVSEGINVDLGEKKETDEKGERAKVDDFGHDLLFQKRIGEFVAKHIEKMSGIESRAYQATHPHRGEQSAYDAVAGFRLGIHAGMMVINEQWGMMASLKNDQVISVPIGSYAPRRVITPDDWQYSFVKDRNEGKI